MKKKYLVVYKIGKFCIKITKHKIDKNSLTCYLLVITWILSQKSMLIKSHLEELLSMRTTSVTGHIEKSGGTKLQIKKSGHTDSYKCKI